MFDRIYKREIQAPNYPQKVTVVENRAPTDASVRLLKDMEAAARKNIKDSIRLDSNIFKGVVHTEQDYGNAQYVFKVFFDLNGSKHELEHRTSSVLASREAVAEMAKKVAEVIAGELLPSFAKVLRDEL